MTLQKIKEALAEQQNMQVDWSKNARIGGVGSIRLEDGQSKEGHTSKVVRLLNSMFAIQKAQDTGESVSER